MEFYKTNSKVVRAEQWTTKGPNTLLSIAKIATAYPYKCYICKEYIHLHGIYINEKDGTALSFCPGEWIVIDENDVPSKWNNNEFLETFHSIKKSKNLIDSQCEYC